MEKIRWNAYFLHQKSDETLVAKTRLEIISNLSNLLSKFAKSAQWATEFGDIGNYPQPFSKLAKLITEFGEITNYFFSPNLPKVHNELISWDTWEIISKLAQLHNEFGEIWDHLQICQS